MPRVGDPVELWLANGSGPIEGTIVAIHPKEVVVCCNTKRFSAVVGRQLLRRNGTAAWIALARSEATKEPVSSG